MSNELFPEFGTVGPPQRCGFGTTLENACGKPATWHVLWSSRGNASLECEFHHRVAHSRWLFYADHPFDPNCCLPGASYDKAKNRCFWPEEDSSWCDAVEEWMAGPDRQPLFQ